MLTTFFHHNTWFDGKIIILVLESEPLDDSNVNILKLIYQDVEVIIIPDEFVYELKRKVDIRNGYVTIQDYFKIFAFKIKSMGNIYISKNVVFNNNSIHTILNGDTVSVASTSDRFPNIGSNIDANLMFIPESYICDDNFNCIYSKLVGSVLDGTFEYIETFAIEVGIEFNILSSSTLVNASIFPNNKYSNLVRYSNAISAILVEISVLSSSNYTRIQTYWNHLLHKSQSVLNNPRHIAIKTLYAKSININARKLNGRSIKHINNIVVNSTLDLKNIKIGLCTVCNDSFIDGACVMISSFVKNNKWYNGDIIVLYNSKHSDLSIGNMDRLSKLYDKIIFKNIDERDYEGVFNRFIKMYKGTKRERFLPSFFTYDAFELSKKYNKLLFLDADMVILSDVSEIFHLTDNIIVTPDAGVYNIISEYKTFNGGFILCNGDQSDHKRNLLGYSLISEDISIAEQGIMNDYFNGNVTMINTNYNCLKRCFPDSNFSNFKHDVKIIHYVGAKPWHTNKDNNESKYTKLEEFWIKANNEIPKYDKVKSMSIVTSSCNMTDEMITGLDNSFIMTANWGIISKLPKIDYYICSTIDLDLFRNIKASQLKPRVHMLTYNVKDKLGIDNSINHFEYMGSLGNLGKMHMRSKEARKSLNLPTSGVQMIYMASYADITELNIYGINLYTESDGDGNYKKIGSSSKDNPYLMKNKPHDLATDILFLNDSFNRLMSKNIKINVDTKALETVRDMVAGGSTVIEITQKIKSMQ